MHHLKLFMYNLSQKPLLVLVHQEIVNCLKLFNALKCLVEQISP